MQFISKSKKNPTYCNITRKLLIIYAIQSICGGIAFYIALFLKSNTGLDVLHIGIVISATSIGNIFGSYIGGYLSDKHNPFYALKIGLGVQGLTLLCLVFVTNFYAIFLVMLALGSGSYLYITSSNYILNSKFDNNEKNRIQIISNQAIISNAGMFFSAILMGYCAAGYYQPIFISVALIMLFIAVKLKPFGKNYYRNIQDNEIELIKKSSTKYCFLGLFTIGLVGIMYSQHRTGYPIFLESNFGNINTGYLMAINPLIILIFQNIIIKKSTKVNEIFALGIGLFIFGISFFILNLPVSIGVIGLSCSILTLGEILATTYAQSITFGYAPEYMRGRILGFYKSIYAISKMVGSYIAGLLIHYTNYRVLWESCGLIGVIGFLIILLINSNSKSTLIVQK